MRRPLLLSGLVLLSQAFPVRPPVRDAATLLEAAGFHFQLPLWHVLWTPFCSLADLFTVMSAHQIYVLLAYITVGCVMAGRKLGPFLLVFFLMFAAWGVLIPRPMARLVANNPDVLLIDFHSHSCVSHDGRKSFTPESNMLWHRLQGYDAAFITDHNRVESAGTAMAASRQGWLVTHYRSLEGEEVSLQKTHLVILGNHERVNNQPYDGDYAKIPGFVRDMHKAGYPVIASLPEYWFYHWHPSPVPSPLWEGRGTGGARGEGSGDVYDFARWGMDGFEIINSAPKAMDFPLPKRIEIVDLCRRQNLFMTGISDNHGYGYATAAWNAMVLHDWQSLDPDSLQIAVLKTLKEKRFEAVQVLERIRYVPGSVFELAISPMASFWLYWRGLQPLQAVSWVLWILLISFCYPRVRSVTQRSGPKI